MDIHNWIMDIYNWIDYRVYGLWASYRKVSSWKSLESSNKKAYKLIHHRTANISWRMCVIVYLIQSNPIIYHRVSICALGGFSKFALKLLHSFRYQWLWCWTDSLFVCDRKYAIAYGVDTSTLGLRRQKTQLFQHLVKANDKENIKGSHYPL